MSQAKAPELDPDRLEYYRSRFIQAEKEHDKRVILLNPEPRFDDIYQWAIRRLKDV